LHVEGAELGDVRNVAGPGSDDGVELCDVNAADISENPGQSQVLNRRGQPLKAGVFGPWSPSPSISPMERTAQFRSLASLAATFFGSNHPIVRELRCAETDSDAAARALDLLNRTPTLTRRMEMLCGGRTASPRW